MYWKRYSTPHWPSLPKGEEQFGKANHKEKGQVRDSTRRAIGWIVQREEKRTGGKGAGCQCKILKPIGRSPQRRRRRLKFIGPCEKGREKWRERSRSSRHCLTASFRLLQIDSNSTPGCGNSGLTGRTRPRPSVSLSLPLLLWTPRPRHPLASLLAFLAPPLPFPRPADPGCAPRAPPPP